MTTADIDEAYPRMETERLILRALRMEDADFVLKEWGTRWSSTTCGMRSR